MQIRSDGPITPCNAMPTSVNLECAKVRSESTLLVLNAFYVCTIETVHLLYSKMCKMCKMCTTFEMCGAGGMLEI